MHQNYSSLENLVYEPEVASTQVFLFFTLDVLVNLIHIGEKKQKGNDIS